MMHDGMIGAMVLWTLVGIVLIIVLVVVIIKLVQKEPGRKDKNGYPSRDRYPLAALTALNSVGGSAVLQPARLRGRHSFRSRYRCLGCSQRPRVRGPSVSSGSGADPVPSGTTVKAALRQPAAGALRRHLTLSAGGCGYAFSLPPWSGVTVKPLEHGHFADPHGNKRSDGGGEKNVIGASCTLWWCGGQSP